MEVLRRSSSGSFARAGSGAGFCCFACFAGMIGNQGTRVLMRALRRTVGPHLVANRRGIRSKTYEVAMAGSDGRSRCALVTGSATGLMRGVCVSLARRGYAIAANYRAPRTNAEETLRDIRAAGGDAQ